MSLSTQSNGQPEQPSEQDWNFRCAMNYADTLTQMKTQYNLSIDQRKILSNLHRYISAYSSFLADRYEQMADKLREQNDSIPQRKNKKQSPRLPGDGETS